MTTEKRDWGTIAAVGAGAVATIAGLIFYLQKPPGVDPGEKIKALFTLTYVGVGGTYLLQVSLGRIIIFEPLFDHVEGLTWEKEITLPGPDTYEIGMELELPDYISARSYDAEAGIRLPSSHWLDFIIKAYSKNAVVVREK